MVALWLKYSTPRTLGLLIALLFCGMMVGCKRINEPTTEPIVPDAPNTTISALRETVGQRRVLITEPIVIGGYVTTSDHASNFHRTLCIEDATAGVEIMAGMYDLHNLYPEGCYLSVRLQGCAAGIYNGVLQIGTEAASYSNYPTDYFHSRVLLDKHLSVYDIRKEVAPQPLRVENLTPALCGRLVNIGSLRLSALEPNNPNGEWSGYNIFADESGNTIAVYTSAYATYANQAVPTGAVSLTGILQYGKVDGKQMYIIKMRDEKDCTTL